MVDLETYVENIDRQYIKVLKFMNDLYKHARPQVPLKNIVDYLGNNYSFSDLALYQKSNYSYALVRSTGFLEHESSTEVIQSIYECLDNDQIGISYSDADMEPFKNFYFKFSEVSKFYEYLKPHSPKIEVSNAVSPSHELFKDKPIAEINQYQKNLDDDYLTIDEVITNLNNRAGLFYNYDKIKDLARKKKITPCFYFNGYVCGLTENPFNGLSPNFIANPYTEIMTGYFTYRLLVEQISSQDDYITLPSCEVGNEILIYRLLERQGSTKISYGDGLALFEGKPKSFDDYNNNRKKFSCIAIDEIRFSKRELNSYIASLANTRQHATPAQNDSELLAKLETAQIDNDNLTARLNKASDIYRQNQSEIKELKVKNEQTNAKIADLEKQLSQQADVSAHDSILQTILDESHEHHAPDLSYSIKLWSDLYIDGQIGTDSHSNKANLWINNNTSYGNNTINSSVKRLREVSTPLKDFGGLRSKEIKK